MDAYSGMRWEEGGRRHEQWKLIAEAMRRQYEHIVREPIPDYMRRLLEQADRANDANR